MNTKNKIIVVILLVLFVLVTFIMYDVSKNNKNNDLNVINENVQKEYNDMIENSVMYNDKATMSDLKNEYKITGEDDLYQIDTEFDGRKVINVKPSINYKVAFSGMIKGSKPEFGEIDKIYANNAPQKNGIWINEQSREKIINCLNNSEKIFSKYEVDSSGYLQILEKNEQSDFDKKIEKLISGDMQIVLDVSSVCYMVDSVTGQIIENAYNDLEEFQTYEYFSDNSKNLIFVTENEGGSLTNDEILESVLNLFAV